jgi:hypothetical protein
VCTNLDIYVLVYLMHHVDVVDVIIIPVYKPFMFQLIVLMCIVTFRTYATLSLLSNLIEFYCLHRFFLSLITANTFTWLDCIYEEDIGCIIRRDCVPFASTCVPTRISVGCVLLIFLVFCVAFFDLVFFVMCLV